MHTAFTNTIFSTARPQKIFREFVSSVLRVNGTMHTLIPVFKTIPVWFQHTYKADYFNVSTSRAGRTRMKGALVFSPFKIRIKLFMTLCADFHLLPIGIELSFQSNKFLCEGILHRGHLFYQLGQNLANLSL